MVKVNSLHHVHGDVGDCRLRLSRVHELIFNHSAAFFGGPTRGQVTANRLTVSRRLSLQSSAFCSNVPSTSKPLCVFEVDGKHGGLGCCVPPGDQRRISAPPCARLDKFLSLEAALGARIFQSRRFDGVKRRKRDRSKKVLRCERNFGS